MNEDKTEQGKYVKEKNKERNHHENNKQETVKEEKKTWKEFECNHKEEK